MRRIHDAAVVVLFLAGIGIPLLAGLLTQDRQWSEAEKRALAAFPEWHGDWRGTAGFIQGFERYYNDHFGLREYLISRYHHEMEKRFDLAGSPLVLKGEGGWHFYTGNDLLRDFRGAMVLGEKRLAQWHARQEARRRWLAERGIAYLTFSPPNKQTIYAEYMPEKIRKASGVTRMQQLHDALAAHPLACYIDVHETLAEARRVEKVYYATDTHWNDYGAYIAFRRVMAEVARLFPSAHFRLDFTFRQTEVRAGDLAAMLMIDKHTTEVVPLLQPGRSCGQVEPFSLPLSNVSSLPHEVPIATRCATAALRAVVFGDSFMARMQPFFSENFVEVVYLLKPYDQANVVELVDSFRPDLVIDMRVERNFFRPFEESGW